MCPLMLIFDSHLFGPFATVEFHKSGSTLATVARVITFAKLIELSNSVSKVLAIKVSEDYRELSLKLFKVDKSPEEGRDDMVFAFAQDTLNDLGFKGLLFFFLLFLGTT